MAIKRVREPFAAVVGGVPRSYTVGQLVEDGDPVIKGREQFFEDVEAHLASKRSEAKPVEQATAGPGEKRAVARPSRPARRTKSKDEKAGESQ